jgi:photosystem II stability/assembly factor-like uncharacterized protein
MRVRTIIMLAIATLLFGAVFTGAVQSLQAQPKPVSTRPALENVRDYTPATSAEVPAYAVDAGVLFAGGPGSWTEVVTPKDIIVGAVAVDSTRPGVLYVGAANELTLFRSTDAGESWMRVPLSDEAGGVTDIAVDGVQHLVYVGTDTAGVFRLRDVGSSMITGGQLLLDEPVRQVATDSTGAAMAFVRTDTALYRADNYGLSWTTVDDLHSNPTALAVANTEPATVYVGTTDRGVLTSTDGQTWALANEGLGLEPGNRLHVDALAVDPINPDDVYVAASYLFGSTTLHQTPSRVATSEDGALTWTLSPEEMTANVAELLPVSGTPGAVYALTTSSRTPVALYDVPETTVAVAATDAASAQTGIASARAAQPVPWAWMVAGLAALGLAILVAYDVRQRGVRPLAERIPLSALDTQTLTTQALSTQTLPTVG